jgi:hypothetical protein
LLESDVFDNLLNEVLDGGAGYFGVEEESALTRITWHERSVQHRAEQIEVEVCCNRLGIQAAI